MTYTSLIDLKKEFLYFLRNQDVISTVNRGVTSSTVTGVLTASTSVSFPSTLVKNVRSIVVGGNTLSYGNDYTLNLVGTASATFSAAQSGAFTAVYDYGSTDRVWDDYPQLQLKLSDTPRIGFDIISGDTREVELGAGSNQSDYVLSVSAYQNSIRGVENLISDIRQKVMQNKKSFHYIVFVTPKFTGPLLPSPVGENKIWQRNQDFDIRFIFETS